MCYSNGLKHRVGGPPWLKYFLCNKWYFIICFKILYSVLSAFMLLTTFLSIQLMFEEHCVFRGRNSGWETGICFFVECKILLKIDDIKKHYFQSSLRFKMKYSFRSFFPIRIPREIGDCKLIWNVSLLLLVSQTF